MAFARCAECHMGANMCELDCDELPESATAWQRKAAKRDLINSRKSTKEAWDDR